MTGKEDMLWDDVDPEMRSSFTGARTETLLGESGRWGLRSGGWRTEVEAISARRHLFPPCRHWRQRFELNAGVAVFASAWFDRPSLGAQEVSGFVGSPDVGFYLDRAWLDKRVVVSPGFRPPFATKGRERVVIYPWRDYGAPERPRLFVRALEWLLEEAGRGKIVEIGCAGAHGRTGTTLACLLVLQGVSAERAAKIVRSRHCEESIESAAQVEFVVRLASNRP